MLCESRHSSRALPPAMSVTHWTLEATTMTAQKSTKLVKSKPLVKIFYGPHTFVPANDNTKLPDSECPANRGGSEAEAATARGGRRPTAPRSRGEE
jgi:hypothetical protein